jgi:hypothetical protein
MDKHSSTPLEEGGAFEDYVWENISLSEERRKMTIKFVDREVRNLLCTSTISITLFA